MARLGDRYVRAVSFDAPSRSTAAPPATVGARRRSRPYFETMLRAEIVLPAEAIRPGEPYLAWHQQRIYKGNAVHQPA